MMEVDSIGVVGQQVIVKVVDEVASDTADDEGLQFFMWLLHNSVAPAMTAIAEFLDLSIHYFNNPWSQIGTSIRDKFLHIIPEMGQLFFRTGCSRAQLKRECTIDWFCVVVGDDDELTPVAAHRLKQFRMKQLATTN